MMFAIGIRYLMGWAMAAADGAKRERAEWPPHPDRIFMALAAAWFETGQDLSEGEALRWLEQQRPPEISASAADLRRPVTSYVPVNDVVTGSGKKIADICNDVKSTADRFKEAGLTLLQEHRPRQPKAFPVAIPHDPTVYLCWPVDLPEAHREPLASVCRKVTSVGHSASLVQMWVAENPGPPTLVPTSGVASRRLRVFGPGRLSYLEGRCSRHALVEYLETTDRIKAAKGKEKKKLVESLSTRFPAGSPVSLPPEPGLWQGYDEPKRTATAVPLAGLFDPRLVVLSITGRRLTLPSTLKVAETLRGALLSGCPNPIPEWLSGHAPDGAASRKPHLSILPLPFTGSRHADGRLLGVALALPAQLDAAEVDSVLTQWLWGENGEVRKIRLFNGEWLECEVALETRESPPATLLSETWTGACREWASVTPVVFDRHYDGPQKWEQAAESVKDGCERIGLPRPSSVLLHPVSMIEGVPRSNDFPWMVRKKDGGRLHHCHVLLVFDEPVQGPVIVGAGRFRGYGLCRPLRQGGGGNV